MEKSEIIAKDLKESIMNCSSLSPEQKEKIIDKISQGDTSGTVILFLNAFGIEC